MTTSALVVLAVAFALVAWRLAGARGAPADVVARKIQGGAIVIDVRSPAEVRRASYPGAVNIPLPELSGRLGEIPRDRPVVLFCASGIRSGHAAKLLERAGFADVVNAGGLAAMPPRR